MSLKNKPNTALINQKYTKEERIRSKKDYILFFNNPVIYKFPEFYLYKIPSNTENAKLGITIKSKTNSVLRNKLKRTFKEFFRKEIKQLGAFNYNFVIFKDIKIDAKFIKKLKLRLMSAKGHI